MPIFRAGDRLHYFADVPRCAGASVEAYLARRFGALALLDTGFTTEPEAARWSRSSPQHIPLSALYRIVPADWIASSFAVVRHPVTRLVSAFRFHVDVERSVAPLWTIDEWFDDWLARADREPFAYDNHLRPMADLVPDDATVFRMEDGLNAVVAHLDAIAGNSDGPRSIAAKNVSGDARPSDEARLTPSPETMARIATYYAEDIRRFGYAVDTIPDKAEKQTDVRGFIARLTGRRG